MSDCMILSMNAESNAQWLAGRVTESRGKELLRAARILPLATVAAGIVTIFVPVLDSGNADGPSIRITSLGYSPLDPTNLNPGMTSVWVLILTLTVLPWLFRASQWWSVAAILTGVGILVSLAFAVIEPPIMMWDGQTADGMPTGGMEVARPAAGFAVCTTGSLALVAAGVCGWVGGRRLKRGAQA